MWESQCREAGPGGCGQRTISRSMTVAVSVVVSWSGGKDSALALLRVQQMPRYRVVGLLTTLTRGYGRVAIHGVRQVLLEAQAEALGLALHRVWLPPQVDNAGYEAALGAVLVRLRQSGVHGVVSGDLFLQDVRAYRERVLVGVGLEPVFPLWGEDTVRLARQVIADGIHATVVCVDPQRVPKNLVGRPYDSALLDALPPGVDLCGENGEFHTFVHAAPNFRYPLRTVAGVTVERSGLVYRDLLPLAPERAAGD